MDRKSAFSLLAPVLIGVLSVASSADDRPPAGRPWFGLCLASLDNLHGNIDAALLAADRPELAEVLVQRIERWQNLAGLDRTRPLGLVRFWPHRPDASPEEVLFLPATDRAQFMKTVTFGVVEFAPRSPDHYVIARPEIPYHVQFRNDNVAWMGDRTATLAVCSGMLDDWTSELVSKHDLGLFWDLQQVPVEQRRAASDAWRRALEPQLQQRDGEPDDLFQWRREWSAPLVTASSLAIEQTRRVLLRVRFDRKKSAAIVTLHLYAEPRSAWAALLPQWRAARSPWQSLADVADARSTGFIAGLPAIKMPGRDGPPVPQGGQIVWQVFGDSLPLRTAVLALSDGPADPPLRTLEAQPAKPNLERVRIPQTPDWVRPWIGGNTEAWLVRDRRAVWLAFGAPEPARKRLEAALQPPENDDPPQAHPPVCLSARIPLRECLGLIPWFDRNWMHEELTGREDRIEVTVTHVTDGLQLQAVLPGGVLRLLGGIVASDLAQEADRLIFAPRD